MGTKERQKELKKVKEKEKKKRLKLVKFLQDYEEGDTPEEDVRGEFEASIEALAVSRFRICLAVFIVLFPLLSLIESVFAGVQPTGLSRMIQTGMEVILFVYAALTWVPSFKKNIYGFTFSLMLLIGFYSSSLFLIERSYSMDQTLLYALVFFTIGILMPWGGKDMMGICLPVYFFHPLGMTLGILTGLIEVPLDLILKSNFFLFLFVLIVIVGASTDEGFRFHEFMLNKRLQGANRMLEDFQERLKRAYARMENLAIMDKLTETYNRTYLAQYLSTDIFKKHRHAGVFSILMYDMDHFKEVNDLAGHQMGDRILQRLTEIMRESLDVNASIFRYGGDEFCVVMPGIDMRRAIEMAEQARSRVEAHPDLLVKLSETESVRVTTSMGVISDLLTGVLDMDFLIRWVDAALYESKRQGRNCIHVFDSQTRKVMSAQQWILSSKDSKAA